VNSIVRANVRLHVCNIIACICIAFYIFCRTFSYFSICIIRRVIMQHYSFPIIVSLYLYCFCFIRILLGIAKEKTDGLYFVLWLLSLPCIYTVGRLESTSETWAKLPTTRLSFARRFKWRWSCICDRILLCF